MLQGDFSACAEFATWLQNQNEYFFGYILFCIEKNGILNVYYAHHYSYVGANPYVVRESQHQNRGNINVWIGVVDVNLLGPVKLPDRLNGFYMMAVRDHFRRNV